MSTVRRRPFPGAVELTRRIGIPVTVLFVIGLAGIAAMTALAARGRDADAREASWHNALSALIIAEDRLGELATDFASGDDVYRNLHQSFDTAWAANNLSTAPHDVYGIEHVFVFGPRTELAFSSHRPLTGTHGSEEGQASESLRPWRR